AFLTKGLRGVLPCRLMNGSTADSKLRHYLVQAPFRAVSDPETCDQSPQTLGQRCQGFTGLRRLVHAVTCIFRHITDAMDITDSFHHMGGAFTRILHDSLSLQSTTLQLFYGCLNFDC